MLMNFTNADKWRSSIADAVSRSLRIFKEMTSFTAEVDRMEITILDINWKVFEDVRLVRCVVIVIKVLVEGAVVIVTIIGVRFIICAITKIASRSKSCRVANCKTDNELINFVSKLTLQAR